MGAFITRLRTTVRTRMEDAQPAKYFAKPPYTAHHSGGDNSWWYVANKDGINCLTFKSKPGAVFTNEQAAKEIADKWNKVSES